MILNATVPYLHSRQPNSQYLLIQEVNIMNETIKNLLERRSIRAYKKDPVPQETLDLILKAGEYSPSGMGQ